MRVVERPSAELVDGSIHLKFPYNRDHVAAVKGIGFPRWQSSLKVWVFPYTQDIIAKIQEVFPGLEVGAALQEKGVKTAESVLEAEARKYVPEQRDVKISDFKFQTEPLWHQKVTFNFSRALDQSALFLEQGLGKTKCAIDLATWRFREGQVHRVLYVAPNSVVPQWRTDDVLKHLHPDFDKVTILDGSSKNRIKLIDEVVQDNRPGWMIINYEALLFIEYHLDRVQGKNQALYQMTVFDESSKVKHATSQRSKVCWRLAKKVKYRNIMTGTPITQGAEDAFSQYRVLDESIFGPYATAFRGQYLILGGFENRQCIGYRNIGEFYKKLFSVGIRFTKEQCLNLPKKVYEKRTATLDADVSKKYRQLEKECVAEFAGKTISAPLVMTKLMKLSQVTAGFIYEQDEAGERLATHTFKRNPKLEVLKEIFEEVGEHKKVVVWCRFVEEIRIITEFLKMEGIGFTAIHGAIKAADRGTAVERFQTDQTVRVFVGQVATASLGITLTAGSVVVYFSNDYSLESRLQSEDRCHRIGQESSVLYIDILAQTADGKSTIDHDALDIIRGKNKFANEVSMALVSRMVSRTEEGIKKNPAHRADHRKSSDVDLEEQEFE